MKLPDKIFGEDVQGKYEKFLERTKDKKKEPPKSKNTIINIQDFIHVPELNLYFTNKRVLTSHDYTQTHEDALKYKLPEQLTNPSVPIPYQFRSFLKYLRDSDDKKHKELFKDITEVKNPYRANWLNAKFEKRKNGLYMLSKNVLVNKGYQDLEEKLEDYLDKDKIPGIDLNSWIDSTTSQGLPKKNISNGSLYYWAPVNGSVARFGASALGADLFCNRDPANSYAGLGVFLCAVGTEKK